MTIDLVVGVYEHYKGGRYFVLGTAMHTENKEMMVVYRDLSSNELYVRPKEMFLENVMKEGKEVPRFKYIKD